MTPAVLESAIAPEARFRPKNVADRWWVYDTVMAEGYSVDSLEHARHDCHLLENGSWTKKMGSAVWRPFK